MELVEVPFGKVPCFLSGGIAGLVGVSEVLGNSHCFRMGFSADYGFVGIAVALVARGNLLAVIPSAFLLEYCKRDPRVWTWKPNK